MIQLSGRYTTPVLALLALAALPVWLHAASGVVRDDCAHPAALLAADRIAGTRPDPERRDSRAAHHVQWTEGSIAPRVPGRFDLSFRIIRSYDLSRFYGVPYWTFFHNAFPDDRRELRRVRADGYTLPIHWRYDDSEGVPRVIEYLYVLDGRPARHPFTASLRSALPQLLGGTRPVTLFVVYGIARPGEGAEPIERSADAWLVDAWRYYESVCKG